MCYKLTMRTSRFNSHVTTHPDNLNKFPYLSRLHQLGDGEKTDSYFSVLAEASLRPGDERQFIEWENQIAGLDHSSRTRFLDKAGSVVSIRDRNGRGWHQLVEIFNEIKGYVRAVALRYDCVRFINDNSQSLPDIEAFGAPGNCLIEVKTINESAAASLAEGLEETLTLHRLKVFPELGVSFKTTNLIESVMARIEAKAHRVTCWRTSDQKLRWCAAALTATARQFRRVKAYRHLPLLQQALQPKLTTNKSAAA